MKSLILKIVSGSPMENQIKERYKDNQNYFYNLSDTNTDKIHTARDVINRLFKNREKERIQTIIFIYSSYKKKFIKGYYGIGKLHNYSINLEIELLKELKENQVDELEKLYYKNYSSDLKLIPQYVLGQELPQNLVLEIVYGKKQYNQNDYKEFSKFDSNKISTFIKDYESNLNELAQKSIYVQRPIGYKESSNYRSEFQRDKERIIHSKAFRRIVDKAQIYTSTKGDHYRTRLTHTLEVSQIARGIGRALKLNDDLIEAIALGHDIGHTPFGHEGERELNLILTEKNDYFFSENENFGGFKHNYQGVKVLNYLEEKYTDIEGLDISYQVLEGVLKHTKIKKCKKDFRTCKDCKNICYDIDEFLIIGDKEKLYLDFDFPTTLEGQIVNQADEIAQRGHDLDDGISSGVLKFDELLSDLEKIRDTIDMKEIIDIIEKSIEECKESKRVVIDSNDIKRAIIVPKILGYFMKKLINNSKD